MKFMDTLAYFTQVDPEGFTITAYESDNPIHLKHSFTIGKDCLSQFCIQKWGLALGDQLPVEMLKELKYLMSLIEVGKGEWLLFQIRVFPE